MEKDIKNEELNEEIVNEEQEKAAEEQTASADAANEAEAPKELTPEERIAELEKQVEDLKNQQLYKVAEFDNFRKRVMQEKAELIKNGGAKVITTLLPKTHRGDLLAMLSAGAYGEIMASGYNCRRLPEGYTDEELKG